MKYPILTYAAIAAMIIAGSLLGNAARADENKYPTTQAVTAQYPGTEICFRADYWPKSGTFRNVGAQVACGPGTHPQLQPLENARRCELDVKVYGLEEAFQTPFASPSNWRRRTLRLESCK